MSTVVPPQHVKRTFSFEVEVPLPPSNLPTEDGLNLESDWHRLAMTLLIELIGLHLKGREDYFVGGNMFMYFSAKQVRKRDFRGPDFFFVWGVPLNPPRPYWAIWDEDGKYPNVIIELSSPSTLEVDHGIKKKIYEQTFHTREYFTYDPARQLLQGWRLNEHSEYAAIEPNDKGWLWCEQLQLWLGTWHGKYLGKQELYLRFFDTEGNLIPSSEELTAIEKLNAEIANRQAEQEKKRTDAEKKRADAEKKRADAAEAELARLKAKSKKRKS
jgi:Uma2 family endonuclease